MKRGQWMLIAGILLAGCGDQAQKALDKNPGYAGKQDKHATVIPERDKLLRKRVLMGQTDR